MLEGFCVYPPQELRGEGRPLSRHLSSSSRFPCCARVGAVGVEVKHSLHCNCVAALSPLPAVVTNGVCRVGRSYLMSLHLCIALLKSGAAPLPGCNVLGPPQSGLDNPHGPCVPSTHSSEEQPCSLDLAAGNWQGHESSRSI